MPVKPNLNAIITEYLFIKQKAIAKINKKWSEILNLSLFDANFC